MNTTLIFLAIPVTTRQTSNSSYYSKRWTNWLMIFKENNHIITKLFY